jgi:hypothetical protein
MSPSRAFSHQHLAFSRYFEFLLTAASKLLIAAAPVATNKKAVRVTGTASHCIKSKTMIFPRRDRRSPLAWPWLLSPLGNWIELS